MSIRVAAAVLFVLFFSVYAWRNWFTSLCSAIVLMAVLEHPDMPKSLGGIQGVNLWNILILNVIGGWWIARGEEGNTLDIPRPILVFGLLFFGVILIGFFRLISDPVNVKDFSVVSAVSEYLVNTVKWVVPGILLADGCRDPKRLRIAMFCLLAVYVLLAVQVIRWMPISYVSSGDALSARASKLIQNEIGYNRVTLSNMLAGGSWAVLAALPLIERKSLRLATVGCAMIVLLGQALTGGRTGYLSWGVVGLTLCFVKWRRMLPIIPLAAFLVASLVPAVRERMLMGVGSQTGVVVSTADDYEMTSGRTLVWPYVIEKIREEVFFGHGRLAMIRTGLSDYLATEYEELFSHPHNAYLEVLLDNGVLGFLVAIPLYLLLLKRAFYLFHLPEDPMANAVGGAACAVVIALLVGSLGGQTFYPREGSVAMWAVLGLVLRLSVDRKRAAEAEVEVEKDDAEENRFPGATPSWA